MRTTRQGARAPGPDLASLGQARPGTARLGGTHGQETTQDPRGLSPLPRGHPPRVPRRRHGVDHWRATCTERVPAWFGGGPRGTGPVSQVPHRVAYPVESGMVLPPGGRPHRPGVGAGQSDRRPAGQGHPSRRRPPPRRHPSRAGPSPARRRRRLRHLPDQQGALPGLSDRARTTAGRSPPASSKAPAATSSKIAWTSPEPAGDCPVPRPSSSSEPSAATATSTPTGATTSHKNADASTNPATSTDTSRRPRDHSRRAAPNSLAIPDVFKRGCRAGRPLGHRAAL